MPKFFVLPELCRQDGICASVCPAHAIKGPKGRTPEMRPGAEQSCISCGQCMAFCPHGAARVDSLPVEYMRRIERKRLPDTASVEQLLMSRRSIRHFKKQAIPQALLEEILVSTRHAPSAKNFRPVRWIVAYEQETMRAIGNGVAEWLEAIAAQSEKPLIAEAKALARAWRMGLDPLFRGAPHLVFAVTPADWKWGVVDAAIALTYLEIAALPHSVGACWAGYVATAVQQHAPLQKMLGVRQGEAIQGGQMLGLIALKPTYSVPRPPLPVSWL